MSTTETPFIFCATSSASLRLCRLAASSCARRCSKMARFSLVARNAFFCGKRKFRAKPGRTFTTWPIWPSFSTRSSRMISIMTSLLLQIVGQQAEKARALDRLRQFALLAGRDRGDARRHDLATLGDEALQQLHVLVVDLRRVGAGEGTGLPPAEKRAALCSSLTQNAPSVATAASPSGFRSASRRALLELDCSNWSTFTVMKRSTSSLIRIWRSSSWTALAGELMLRST